MPRKKKQPILSPDEPAATIIPAPVQPTPLESATFAEQMRLRRLVSEIASRTCEALRIYEPLPIIDRFHQDGRDERICRGSNRAGKTLGAAVEMARAATGQDPYGKFPTENGRAYLIGLDGQHLGEVMYRKLFRSGAFKMIRDEQTGEWRAYRPATDAHREKQTKPAPPLIPKRFVKEIAWEDKKRNIPRTVTLTTGWELSFYSSKGAPPQGSDIDLYWLDEEIENEQWYPELSARILDRRGKGFWSATPQIASQQLYDLHERAENGDPNVGEHIALLEDNPHIGQAEKDKLYARLVTDEERRVRIKGEFALAGFKVYPEFSRAIHGYDLEGPQPPEGWAHYLVVDPGRQVCAVLFAAVPPPPDDFVLLWQELYLKNCDASSFGKEVASASIGVTFQAFLIDSHAGRVTEMGSGRSVEEQYSAALKTHKVKSLLTGHGFLWGSDDPKAGVLAVKEWLRIRADGTPKLRVARGRLKNFEWEIDRYKNRRIRGLVTDEPDKRNDHLMDGLRYLAMYQPRWRKVPKGADPVNYAVRAMRDKQKRKREREGKRAGASVRLGPGR